MVSFDKLKDHPKSKFTYWFKPTNRRFKLSWDVYHIIDLGTVVGVYDEANNIMDWEDERYGQQEDIFDEIVANFNMFKSYRPEYYMCGSVDDTGLAVDDLYDMFLIGAMLAANNNMEEDKIINKLGVCLNWLHSTDFYTSPASSIYHGSKPSGLVEHCLDVVFQIRDLYYLPKFSNVKLHDAILVALVHDWCKIGRYEQYIKNVKNDSTGQWEQIPAYRYNKEAQFPFGHGEGSMFMAQKLLHLSTEQALAIRWHMGAWRVHESDMNDLQYSNENYPLVHMLQFADQLSIVNY
jgi:hypothetical protein